MIDVSNLKDALETLGFVAHGDIHEKVFPEIGCSLKVDFHAKKLIYPNEIKGRERNNGIAFTVPDISIQNNAMSKVADYEMAIKELEGSLEKIASRRSEIIRKALAE